MLLSFLSLYDLEHKCFDMQPNTKNALFIKTGRHSQPLICTGFAPLNLRQTVTQSAYTFSFTFASFAAWSAAIRLSNSSVISPFIIESIL